MPGEYISISAHAGIITPIWMRVEDGKTSVWTTVIKEDMLKDKVSKEEKPKK